MSLTVFPSPTVSTINLIFSCTALATTITTLFPISVRPAFATVLRLLHSLVLLSPSVLSLYTLSTLISTPLETVSPPSPSVSMFRILNAAAAPFNATVGLTRQTLRPDSEDAQITPVIHIFVILFSLLSIFLITVHRNRVRREASVIAFVAASVYILATLLTAFRPGTLSLDSSLLRSKWLDEAYTDFDAVNETRLLQNFWLKSSAGKVVWAGRQDRFRARFCETFNSLPIQEGLVVELDDTSTDSTRPPSTAVSATTVASSTAATTTATIVTEEEEDGEGEDESTPEEPDEDDRPQPQGREGETSSEEPIVTRNLLSHILIVYTIGKPLFTSIGKSISLLSLPFLTLTPVFIAHVTRSRVLFPFMLGWIGVLLVLTIYGTPETIRWIRAPFEPSDLMTFCGRRYRVFVTDSTTHRIAVFDVVSFAFIGLTAIIQGFRWLRRKEEEEEEEVKMIGFEEVYSQSGSLRW